MNYLWKQAKRLTYNTAIKDTILIVDDEKPLIQVLRHHLERDGFKVLSARNAGAGMKAIRKSRPDLVILDIRLPDMDGLEMLRALRRDDDVPVIVLSGNGGELDRIRGIELGADDYVVKPFSIGEMMARVRGCLRRSKAKTEKKPIVSRGIEVDFERHHVRVDGKAVLLAPMEFIILKLLFEADGKVLSRDVLLHAIWGHDQSIEIHTRAIDQHMTRLRRKLGSQAKWVVTVPNFGYQLMR